MGTENKNLNRVPRSIEDNFDLIERTFNQLGSVLHDIIIFAGNNQMRDLFGEVRFSLEEFCQAMGHDRTKLQRKLTDEQLHELFSKEQPIYVLSNKGATHIHYIETLFEAALYKLGKENMRFIVPNPDGSTSYHFIQPLERFDISYDFTTNKKNKRFYSITLGKKMLDSFFNRYNLFELNDYKILPDKTGYRSFFLYLSKMMFLIKYKQTIGQMPVFNVTVDDLASMFDINEPVNKERKRRVTDVLRRIKKYLNVTKFEFEYVRNGGKYAYTAQFSFNQETLNYFDEKFKAVFTDMFYDEIGKMYALCVYNEKDYEKLMKQIRSNKEEEEKFLSWLYSDQDMGKKEFLYINTFTKVFKIPPESVVSGSVKFQF